MEGRVAVGVSGNSRVQVGAGCGYAGELDGGGVRVTQALGIRVTGWRGGGVVDDGALFMGGG